MAIRMGAFSGETPRVTARLLADNAAQVAQNVRLNDGTLAPFRCGSQVHLYDQEVQTVYRQPDGPWLGWPMPVSVVQAPITSRRIYYTGDGPPKMFVDSTFTFNLALPRPPAKLNLLLSGGAPDPEFQRTIAYSYTYVTLLEEESEPAPLSDEIVWSPGRTIEVSGFTAPPSDRVISIVRIYRTETAANGLTQLYLVNERSAFDPGIFYDTVTGFPIQEALPSTDYNPPPDGLRGLVALPNGMMAAFEGKKVYFSEPYIPHAWPEKYILTVDYPVVALGVFGQSLAILTQGHPYVASGAAPESMTMERLRVNLPCVSMRGVVDLGYAVAYPSTHGLVTVSNGGAQLVTSGLFTPQQWEALNPAGMIAGNHHGRYVATYSVAGGGSGMLILDLSGEAPFLLRGSDTGSAMFSEIGTGKLFIAKDRRLYEWDSEAAPRSEYLWRSKLHFLPSPVCFGTILAEGVDLMTPAERQANRTTRWPSKEAMAAETVKVGVPPSWLEPAAAGILNPATPPAPGFCMVVYADGRPVAKVTEMNRPVRLPAGFMAFAWEVEVRGTEQVMTVSLASSPTELAGG